jgi:hypothetical protein
MKDRHRTWGFEVDFAVVEADRKRPGEVSASERELDTRFTSGDADQLDLEGTLIRPTSSL